MPVSTLPAPHLGEAGHAPSPASHSTLSRQRTRPVTCSHQQPADLVRIDGRPGGDVGDQRHQRRGDRRRPPAPRPSPRRPAASAGSGRARRRSAGWPARPAPWPSRWPGPPPPWRRRSPHCRRCCRWPPRHTRARRRRAAACFAAPRPTSVLGPISEAIAPSPTGTARCMAWPRSFSSRAASASAKRPGRGQGASIRPASGRRQRTAPSTRRTPNSCSSARITARLTAISAGWAFSVRVSVLGRPLAHQPGQLLAQRVVHLLEHLARAAAKASARSPPMPTAWLPWPGKRKARGIRNPAERCGARYGPGACRCQPSGWIAGLSHLVLSVAIPSWPGLARPSTPSRSIRPGPGQARTSSQTGAVSGGRTAWMTGSRPGHDGTIGLSFVPNAIALGWIEPLIVPRAVACIWWANNRGRSGEADGGRHWFPAPAGDFLAGGGEMGALMRAHDWSQPPLGPAEGWPQACSTRSASASYRASPS